MKNKKFLAVLMIGGLALTSCNDFLDQQPATSYTASEIFNNEALTARYMENIYSELTGDLYSTQLPILFGVNSDVELIDGLGANTSAANERGYMNYNTSNAKEWTTNDRLYGNLYQVIGECNAVIEGINASSIKDNPNMQVNLGEAYAIRATMYMELTRIYGDVPAVFETAREDLSNVYVGKSDRDFILEQVMADLEKAEVLLENSTKSADYPSKWYAKALYAQIALQRCGYAIREPQRNQPYAAQGYVDVEVDENGITHEYAYKNASADADDRKVISDPVYPTMRCSDEFRAKYYLKALAKLNEIIKSGNFAVATDFADYWHQMTMRNSGAAVCKQENLFEIPMKIAESGELGYTVGVRLNWDEGTSVRPYGGRNSSGKVKVTSALLYSYEDGDMRRDVTCSLIEVKDSTVVEGSVTESHIAREKTIGDNPFALYVGKWDARYLYENDATWRAQNANANAKQPYGIHVVRMRYPQVLLYYAEILNEFQNNNLTSALSTEDQATYNALTLALATPMDAVNKVHEPAIDPTKTTVTTVMATTYADICKAIENENMWEFAGEGFRKWDLVRWNLLVYNTLLMKDTYIRQMATSYQTTLAYDVTYKPIPGTSYTPGTDAYNANRYTVLSNFDYYGEGGRAVNTESSFGKTYDDLAKKDKDPTKVIKNTDTNLPSISSGLVGSKAPYDSQAKVKPNAGEYLKDYKDRTVTLTPASGVLNRYIFPIPRNVLSSSNGAVTNSYGY